MEYLGIDPSASRMLSERSTIWANTPCWYNTLLSLIDFMSSCDLVKDVVLMNKQCSHLILFRFVEYMKILIPVLVQVPTIWLIFIMLIWYRNIKALVNLIVIWPSHSFWKNQQDHSLWYKSEYWCLQFYRSALLYQNTI